MSTPPPVPATAISRFHIGTKSSTGLAIGSDLLYPKTTSLDQEGFWYVVVDLSTLAVVANEFSASNSTVPASILAYDGKPGYFLYFCSNAQRTNNIPQGALHAFLTKAGAAVKLHALEQMVGQMGTGWINRFSYILAATLDSGDLPGFEEMSVQDFTTLVMSFVPFTSNGTTTYVPALGPATE